MSRVHIAALVAGLLLPLFLSPMTAPPARAETIIRQDATHPGDFSLYGIVAYERVGVGTVWAIPVAPQGFIPDVNEAFFVEVGAELSVVDPYGLGAEWLGLTPMGGVRYQFYVTDKFAPYAAAKFGFTFDLLDRYGVVLGRFYADPSVGFQLTFTPRFGMRFEFGAEGVDVGVSWAF